MKKKDLRRLTTACMLVIALLCTQQIRAAEPQWYLKATNAESVNYLPMSQVGSLVGVDASKALAVLDQEGKTIAEGVTEVEFEQKDPTEVKEYRGYVANPTLLKGVGRQISIIGATELITVFNASGAVIIQQQPSNGETIIDVSNLSSGTYLVKTGQQTFKFIRK